MKCANLGQCAKAKATDHMEKKTVQSFSFDNNILSSCKSVRRNVIRLAQPTLKSRKENPNHEKRKSAKLEPQKFHAITFKIAKNGVFSYCRKLYSHQ